jgi:outer membrane protein OmpA-like peptidoglycan-associated protein
VSVRRQAIVLLLAAACSKPAVPPRAQAAPAKPPAPQLADLLAITEGSAVASRTGESQLTNSAARAIDLDAQTVWVTPPDDAQQSAVFSLGGRARIERAAIVAGAEKAQLRSFTLEFSDDGEHFGRAVTFRKDAQPGLKTFEMPPVDARFVRISFLDTDPRVGFNDLHLYGRFLEEPHSGALNGCWTVNGQPATFAANVNDVSAYVGGQDNTTLEGGSNGRFYRFAWIRGAEYGLAALSVTPDGKHLSGFVWHEEAIQSDLFYANDWFGDRAACAPAKARDSVLETYVRRFGYFPLFGLLFATDGSLDAAESAPLLDRVVQLLSLNPQMRVRFVAHELTRGSAQENLAISKRKIETLRSALASRKVDFARAELVAAGQDHPHRDPTSTITRAMYSSVDLEIRR